MISLTFSHGGGGCSTKFPNLKNSSLLHSCSYKQNKLYFTQNAFTLAEVLITLGIIGIIAAMTLPTVINRANEYILKQQFKKVYNILQNAQMRIYADNESYYNCYYIKDTTSTKSNDCQAMGKHLKKLLNPISICEDNAYSKGCIPKYKGVDTVELENNPDADTENTIRNCLGFTEESILNQDETWVLKDGTIIGWYKYRYNSKYGPLIYVDINGNKRPNKWGYDIFPMIWRGDEKLVRLDANGVCTMAEKGGKSSKQMLEDVWK